LSTASISHQKSVTGTPGMGIPILVAFVSLVFLAVVLVSMRRSELARMSQRLADIAEAKKSGSYKARLQYPHIDLSRCIGCGTCIAACPEDQVLDLVHGQAAVIHGARCVGHGNCANACPVSAISLTLADINERTDIPVLNRSLESPGRPGLFLAGEVTGYALIRTAISHGTSIINQIADDLQQVDREATRSSGDGVDVVIVGAGPAGLAASLQARKRGLSFVTLEQEQLGGTVSKYPRRKLVMTQPVTLPLHGTLRKTSYSKEELMELWSSVAAKHELPILTGQEFTGVVPEEDRFIVTTKTHSFRARKVCIAVGRRGTPRKLGIPGESLPKVAYSLIDAHSFQNRRILVVGGGDSAVEAALGLAAQSGNRVTLSYRQESFLRIKARNQAALHKAIASGQLLCIAPSEVVEIREASVLLAVKGQVQAIPNDDVFVMAGGIPPFKLLADSGVSFDPAERPPAPEVGTRDNGLFIALLVALFFAIATLVWTFWFRSYYQMPLITRPLSPWHALLRPSGTAGLVFGILAAVLVVANLSYLGRRNWFRNLLPGQLVTWMSAHVATGILAFFCVLIHAAFAPRNTIGGHAFAAMALVVITGAIGRYFYSFVPRATNGKELELDEIQAALAADLSEWDEAGREFHDRVHDEIRELVASARWRGNFMSRLAGLCRTNSAVRKRLQQLKLECHEYGLTKAQTLRLTGLASRAYRAALGTAHFEDLRAILNSWRYFHRWIAALMVLLAAAHIATAIRYAIGGL
jgi:thioredoxin reductase/ferredoxin